MGHATIPAGAGRVQGSTNRRRDRTVPASPVCAADVRRTRGRPGRREVTGPEPPVGASVRDRGGGWLCRGHRAGRRSRPAAHPWAVVRVDRRSRRLGDQLAGRPPLRRHGRHHEGAVALGRHDRRHRDRTRGGDRVRLRSAVAGHRGARRRPDLGAARVPDRQLRGRPSAARRAQDGDRALDIELSVRSHGGHHRHLRPGGGRGDRQHHAPWPGGGWHGPPRWSCRWRWALPVCIEACTTPRTSWRASSWASPSLSSPWQPCGRRRSRRRPLAQPRDLAEPPGDRVRPDLLGAAG